MRLTKAQHEKDSMVLGAIIAGSTEKPLKIQETGIERRKSSCAVGASNIGNKVNKPSDILTNVYGLINHVHMIDPLDRFSKSNEVSAAYGCGVNDGFEEKFGLGARIFFKKVNHRSADYVRGWHVGQAAREYAGL